MTTIPVRSSFSAPIFFPVAGLLLLITGLLFTRNNKVFRLQLKRAFGHSHGFFVDIRNGRYIQKSQTYFIGVGASLVLGFILAGTLHFYRLSGTLDIGIGHLFFGSNISENLIRIIWNPFKSLFFLAIVSFIVLFIGTLIFQSMSALTKGRMNTIKAMTMVFWSFAPIIALTPVTVFFYKGLYFPVTRIILAAAAVFCLFWSIIRIILALKVASMSSGLKAWVLFGVINIILLGAVLWIIQYNTGIFYYCGYFIAGI